MPDYYRFLDRLRALPDRCRALPGELLGFPARVRDSLKAGTFPFKQVCLGFAALGMVILAQRLNSHAHDGGQPATGSSKTPAEVCGRWITASSGATQNWSHSTGVYEGSGHGTSQIYQFNADGTYSYFAYMEIRTNFSWVKMDNSCKGKTDFTGDRFSVHPESGHISATGTSYVNRDMNTEDLARWTDTCRWRRENGSDGSPRLIVTSEKGGKQETSEFRVLKD